MVSGLTVVFSVVTLLLSLVFPVLLAIWFCRKYKTPARMVLLGALTFLVSQLILRIPLLQILESHFSGWNLAFIRLFPFIYCSLV